MHLAVVSVGAVWSYAPLFLGTKAKTLALGWESPELGRSLPLPFILPL